MQITELKLSEIIPYENNPRKNDEAVKYVTESIKQFGFKVPIVIDKNNVIVCGHTRYKAAQKLKLKTAPCILADDLTEEQIKAYRLADNKVAEKSEWDFELLTSELDELNFTEINMSDFGFDLMQELEEEPPFDELEKEAPDEGISVKISFDTYNEYSKHEEEIKEFVEKINAKMSLVK